MIASTNLHVKDSKIESIQTTSSQTQMMTNLKENVAQTILQNEKFQDISQGLMELFSDLTLNCLATSKLPDAEVRPLYVNLQGVIEQNLALLLQKGEIKNLRGIIHTPTPATPLCTQGEISENLVHDSILEDTERLHTVKSRANIIRDFLALGGELTVAYPQGGLEKRSDAQREVYSNTLAQFNNLKDTQLNCEAMDSDMVGATYIFEDVNNNEYLFGLKASQANAPKGDEFWQMWFGKTSDEVIADRLNRVESFLNQNVND